MTMPDDLVVQIISHFPLKLAVQCKLLSKKFNTSISDTKFSQTWLQHQKLSTLIYSSHGISKILHKISLNRIPAVCHSETTLPVNVGVLDSTKGLILLDFYEVRNFCVFNPITGAHQLIRYPDATECHYRIGDVGFVVDYPTSDQYKLVTVKNLAEQQGYKFHVFSSEQSDLWREFRMNMGNNTFSYLNFDAKPVYAHDSFHWLRTDDRVLAFNTKREDAIIIDLPEFIINNHGPIFPKWLREAQGLLTLDCYFEKSMVVATYDYASDKWTVAPASGKLFQGPTRYRYIFGFPVWIDNNKRVVFLMSGPPYYLYDYDSAINAYKRAQLLEKDFAINSFRHCYFKPTLASVHKAVLSVTVGAQYLSAINATLDEIKRFITDSNSC